MFLLKFVGPASARSYKIGVLVITGWLVGWLIAQFSLEKSQNRIIEKKLLISRYSRKGLQISPKSDTLTFFLKTALTMFLVFGLKLVLNMTFNLNKIYFSEKFAI